MDANLPLSKLKTYFKNSKDGSLRLAHLMHNVLDTIKVENNNFEINVFPVSIKFICERIFTLIAEFAKERNI